MDTNTNFKSDDILLTAFLLTQGIHLIDVIEESSGRFLFVLSNPDRCVQLEREFLNNAPAPALVLFSKRELLISQIKKRKESYEVK